MARYYYSIERLSAPFSSLDCFTTVVERERPQVIQNYRYKLLLFLGGRVRLTIPRHGRWELRSGDAFLLPFNCKQHYDLDLDKADGHLHSLRISFDRERLDDGGSEPCAVGIFPEDDPIRFIRRHFSRLRHFPGILHEPERRLLAELEREALAGMPGYRFAAVGIIWQLLVSIARSRLSDRERSESDGDRAAFIADRANQYLEEHLSAGISLEEVAWDQRLSAEHVARVFKQATGSTIFQRLAWLRVEAAKELLVNTDDPVGRIAERVGFGSDIVMARNFRKVIGESPSHYRHRIRGRSRFQR